VIVDKDWLC